MPTPKAYKVRYSVFAFGAGHIGRHRVMATSPSDACNVAKVDINDASMAVLVLPGWVEPEPLMQPAHSSGQ